MTSVKRSLKKRASLVLGSEDLVLVQILLPTLFFCVECLSEISKGQFIYKRLPWWFSSKESACRNGNPPLYSCLGNPMDRGAWQATVPGVTKSQTRPRTEHTHYNLRLCCSFVILDKFNFFFLWPLLSFPYFASSWKNSVSLCPASFCTPRPNLPVTPGRAHRGLGYAEPRSLKSQSHSTLPCIPPVLRFTPYGPAEAPVTNGSAVAGPALNDDLDIFGPMISNPLPATVMPPAQGTSSAPAAATLSAVTSGDLDLFTEQAAKSEEVAKKQLSKDSILSLYGAGAIQQQSAPGVFMGPTNLPFTSQAPAAFPGFPSMGVPVPAAPGLVGSSLGPSAGMMVGVPVPNGFMGSAQTAVMPLAQGVVGPPGMVPHMGAAQGKFGLQPPPQSPWNLPQVNQQMAGLSLGGVASAAGFGPPPSTSAGAAGWSGSSSGQTLSTQLWK
ncbi:hypothetical protein FD754_011897 [Muntiacus muntjak]|uniref:Arf-GAP domain-containing protein n=1 Tax=Muntiacus muntjak TaxID=9888 RepID=A0A5N3VCT2_MUNMU|nr:hypothetical protein FD754_011897 [Muntiacus muntjak]